MHLALIPARSGSKGFPDKNIKNLFGRPMIAYSISSALESAIFEDVIVSTDSKQYADIAIQYGASVPFLRSAENALDTSDTWSVVLEVLSNLKKLGKHYDTVTVLQPTSPLRKATHIKDAFELYFKCKAKAVISVCECGYLPLSCNVLDESLSMNGFMCEKNLRRRQDKNTYYHPNGAIYILSVDFLVSDSVPFNPYTEGTYAYIMPKENSVDIDDEMDFLLAETLLQKEQYS